jgi:hypothetical protein
MRSLGIALVLAFSKLRGSMYINIDDILLKMYEYQA